VLAANFSWRTSGVESEAGSAAENAVDAKTSEPHTATPYVMRVAQLIAPSPFRRAFPQAENRYRLDRRSTKFHEVSPCAHVVRAGPPRPSQVSCRRSLRRR